MGKNELEVADDEDLKAVKKLLDASGVTDFKVRERLTEMFFSRLCSDCAHSCITCRTGCSSGPNK